MGVPSSLFSGSIKYDVFEHLNKDSIPKTPFTKKTLKDRDFNKCG